MPSLSKFADDLQSHGRYTFTLAELRSHARRTTISNTMALQRLKKQKRIVSPRRGFYVIVPLEYRSTGSPPVTWFIDDLMKFLRLPYYVGILSAAAQHGAGHQQPMVFQVVTKRGIRDSISSGIRIEFHVNRHLENLPVEQLRTETGTMRVSTPEVTAFDVVRYYRAAGQMNNVATVLSELAEKTRAVELENVARLYSLPEVQRLGYILDFLDQRKLAAALRPQLAKTGVRLTPLVAAKSRGKHRVDPTWKVIVNETLEPDL